MLTANYANKFFEILKDLQIERVKLTVVCEQKILASEIKSLLDYLPKGIKDLYLYT